MKQYVFLADEGETMRPIIDLKVIFDYFDENLYTTRGAFYKYMAINMFSAAAIGFSLSLLFCSKE